MTLETILRTVLHAVAWSALVVFCGVVAGVGVRWMLSKLGHALAETGRRCGKWAAVTLASLALVCAVVAQKANTNAPPDGVSAPAPMMGILHSPAAPDGTGSPVDSENLRERPSTACDVPRWEKRGASDDAIRIPATNWFFQTPDGFVEGMTVFSRGEFRPDVGHLYFPRPFTNDLAFLPQSRWELLPNGEESKLWYAATPSNSLLVTWVNGLLDRNPLAPTNFQAEFFPDGSYEYRYPDHCELHPFVLPFDLDGDGLENTVDPAPLSAGPDAHNTNAEWCNVVSSNIVSAVEGTNGVDLLWRDGVNSNAYYFAEVVVPRGPVPVYFNASQPGRLGSPAVVALKDVTNRVPLHIGVSYAVTSDVPFSISAPEAGFAEIDRRGPCSCDIVWPLRFELASTDQDGVYHVEVQPYDPGGGTFTWDAGSGNGGGPSLMDASPQGSCGCISADGEYVSFSCSQDCDCGGDCSAHGTYRNESLAFSIDVGGCSCYNWVEPLHPDPLEPSFSASVGASAVIYEDAYVDRPGHTVLKRSTRTFVSVSASGGANGGSFTLTTENLDRLSPLGFGPVTFPSTVELAPYETFERVFWCEGGTPSEVAGDVTMSGTFTENETGNTISQNSALTVVKVEISPQRFAPQNRCANRHEFGVYEMVNLDHTPVTGGVTWRLNGRGTEDAAYEGTISGSGALELRCPLYANGASLEVECSGVKYHPWIDFIEPWGVQALNPVALTDKFPVGVYGAAMEIDLYVTPLDVYFGEIAIQEVPSDVSTYWGYFSDDPPEMRSHTVEMMAGNLNPVRFDNWFATDTVSSGTLFGVTCDGAMSWYIPMGWHTKNANKQAPCFREFAQGFYWQDFHVTTNGVTRMDKHGHSIERNLQNRNWLNGALVQ